jgi:hypothetical protein
MHTLTLLNTRFIYRGSLNLSEVKKRGSKIASGDILLVSQSRFDGPECSRLSLNVIGSFIIFVTI